MYFQLPSNRVLMGADAPAPFDFGKAVSDFGAGLGNILTPANMNAGANIISAFQPKPANVTNVISKDPFEAIPGGMPTVVIGGVAIVALALILKK